MPADIYTRLSRYLQDQTSTARQERDCRSIAQTRDVEVAEVHEDVDFSAYSGVTRPGFERLKERVRLGEIDTVIFWKIDRLARNTREFLGFIELCERHGVAAISVNEPFNTSEPIGRVIVTILAAFAELESATISLRVRSARELEAEQGRMHPGGPRRFGYTREMQPHEVEAPAIKAAVRDVLTGSTFHAIARRWNDAGVSPPGSGEGTHWTSSLVARRLRSPHLAALRQHNGDITEGTWAAIITRAEHEAVVARRGRGGSASRRSYFLSGVLVCGICGAPIYGGVTRGVRTYRCAVGLRRPGCGRTSIYAEKAEALVRAAIIEGLSRPVFAPALQRGNVQAGTEAGILAALRGVERQLEELGEEFAAGLPRAAFRAAADRLQAEADRLARELAEAGSGGLLTETVDPAAEWDRRDAEWRSQLTRAIFERIELRPGRGMARERLKFLRRTA
jgi:site-specific DNA recombinase